MARIEIFLPNVVHQQGGDEAEQKSDRGEIGSDQTRHSLQRRRERSTRLKSKNQNRDGEGGYDRKDDLPGREESVPHQPPNISFTLLKKPSASGLVLPAFS